MLYRLICWLLMPIFRPFLGRVEGADRLPEGGFLLAANHIDYLDGFFLTLAVRLSRRRLVQFISETNNYWWAGGATIPIERANKAASLERAMRSLKNGSIICVFPEGRRNASETLLPAKTGIARLALWSGMPVVPVGLVGPMGRTFFGSLGNFFFRRKKISIRFGESLRFPAETVHEVPRDLLHQTSRAIMNALAPLCDKTAFDHNP